MLKTAVVLGATGVVGRALVELLVSSPDYGRIVTLTRRPVCYSSDKVENHVLDFERLSQAQEYFAGDCFFSCLGTTLRQAGSVAAQRQVDLEYQWQAAENALAAGVSHYLLVSSAGAAPGSASAYLRMKGELEARIMTLPFKQISVFQPSLLLGERPEFRAGETIGRWLLPLVCHLPGLRRYRPVRGTQVAEKMLQVSLQVAAVSRTIYTLDQVFPDEYPANIRQI